MPQKNGDSRPLITRRNMLAQTARGAVLASMVPYLSHAQTPPAPGESAPRIRDTFDFGWKFLKGDLPGAQQPKFADANWRDVDLPHDWSIEGPYDEKAPSGGPGGYLPTGIGWYRKRFRVPETHRDRVVVLEFDGVYQNSEVWINGQHLGLRPYGYVPFAYELTPHLNFGGENVIAVRVDNSRQTNCRWYSGSGIYRHTWLLTSHQLPVGYWGTFVTCPRVSKKSATVQVKTRITNTRKNSSACTLATNILDKDGNTVQTQETSQEVEASGEYEFVQQLVVDQPNLWSPANPYLYTVRSTVREAGQVVDAYDTPLGIREAVFDANQGFLLNGEHVKLNGVCLHHEAGCVGAAVPERVWERRLEILRAMGCNAIRTSHNPYAAEFLDLCDRMGFLVMNEAFDEWKVPKGQIRNGYSLYFDEWYERDVKNFLHRDRNHPSVVLWSAGNEVPDQGAPGGTATLRRLLEVFHTEDPTRRVTVACDHIASEPPTETVRPEFLALLDVVGYNYVDRWRDRAQKYYSIDREAFPERRVMGTESVGMGGFRGDYRSLFGDSTSQLPPRFQFRSNRGIDVEQLWKFVRTYGYVAGDFMWTGIDYLGETMWPMKGSPAGVIDTCGFKKDGFYFYQSQWTGKPMLHLFPHWNWKGKEGQFVPVTCYTNCDTVELFLNGKSLGVKGYEFPRYGMEGRYGNFPARARALRTTADLHLSWDVPYEPGTLRAVGTKDGNAVATMEVSTTGEPTKIVLLTDRQSFTSDRCDVAHITVEIQDDQGRIVPVANNEITFDIQGDGRLIGVDNGDPQSHEDYKSNHRMAFNGLCLAIVQSTARAGQVRITASSPSLQPDTLTILSKA
ncbi:MAG TPA: glycoside hydrolase family 2 TIM barrel-domain containing protein [Terriglobia bacterium]|nr:glycoside hydrolase family 2 TIM barrel-domain containing protein [Terriglobia bacterium]